MLLAVLPYVFIAAFPVFGIFLVTKWELDARKQKKSSARLIDEPRLLPNQARSQTLDLNITKDVIRIMESGR